AKSGAAFPDYAALSRCFIRATDPHPTKKNNTMIDGKAIQAARRAAHMSQIELAKAAGMSQRTLSFIERGHTRWSRFLPQIARALNKRPSDFDPEWAEFDGGKPAPAAISSEAGDRLDADYAFYAGEILRIRTKSGA